MLADLNPEDWCSPSRCAGWTVQDVVSHLVGVNPFWRASVRAGLAGEPTRLLTGFDPVETPARMVAELPEMTPTEVLDRLVKSNDAFLAALDGIDDDGWSMLAEAPPGLLPIRLVVQHALWDSWVHERDIAIPLGLTPPTEADEVRSSLTYASALTCAIAIGTGINVAGTFEVMAKDPTFTCVLDVGETVEVREDLSRGEAACLQGDAVALVEALSLRAPFPGSVPAPWLQMIEGLATVFNPTRSSA